MQQDLSTKEPESSKPKSSKVFNSFNISSEVNFDKLNYSNFTDALKLTSFSCAPDIDEHPYTSILMFIDKNEFNCCSSDKHRISIYGKKYTNQKNHKPRRTEVNKLNHSSVDNKKNRKY